jgi:hypothetical protein
MLGSGSRILADGFWVEEISREVKHGLDEKLVFIEVCRTFLIFSTPREI